MTAEGVAWGGKQTEGMANKVVIVVARSGTLYQSLARALEEQMKGCSALVRETSGGADDLDSDARLILFHDCPDYDVCEEIDTYHALHPNVAVGLLIDDTTVLAAHCEALFQSQRIQGILPLTLKLEIWLAAVSLLISGGEYYPSANRRGMNGVPRSPELSNSLMPRVEHPAQAQSANCLSLLTTREQQILELLSEGYQNKLIAHKMSLSEHTVKVHVHNLLSKLHVSNRTQAAATYRRGMDKSLPVSPFRNPQAFPRPGASSRL